MRDLPELKKGDFLDASKLYEVRGLIGKGGFGAVYLIYSLKTETFYAYKTLLPELARDRGIQERFKKEANIWVDLGQHPNLVRAIGVTEQSGRFFICMEYVRPDEQGRNSLDGYLRMGSIEFSQCLKWGIQFCHGMEYAYSKGIQCHRDIKPANIMIDGFNAKVSDFGIARIAEEKQLAKFGIGQNSNLQFEHGQTAVGSALGTPFYMPPEQFIDATTCDQRSDIYSFGVVLYQMRANGSLPFVPPVQRGSDRHEFSQSIFLLHCECPPPKLNSRIGFVIDRCLAKRPNDRYQTFQELRADLEMALKRATGETLSKPQPIKEELNLKGRNLQVLGRHKDAIECFDRELEIDPSNPAAWYNKGKSNHALGNFDEAIRCFYRSAENDFYANWALEENAKLLVEIKRLKEAIKCYERMIAFERPNHSVSDPLKFCWLFERGNLLNTLGQHQAALGSYEQATHLDLRYVKPETILHCWLNKANTEVRLGRHTEATASFEAFLSLAEPKYAQHYPKSIQDARRYIGQG